MSNEKMGGGFSPLFFLNGECMYTVKELQCMSVKALVEVTKEMDIKLPRELKHLRKDEILNAIIKEVE